ncbi:T53I1-like protein [Mya arenaria]|uniref:T53I1-like protein n=1 Tax=Mya arenaria TaxID=6604 RepID=A0ABY7EXH7_MYAAR|nr:T53I1-like protein [Mya arenaria]
MSKERLRQGLAREGCSEDRVWEEKAVARTGYGRDTVSGVAGEEHGKALEGREYRGKDRKGCDKDRAWQGQSVASTGCDSGITFVMEGLLGDQSAAKTGCDRDKVKRSSDRMLCCNLQGHRVTMKRRVKAEGAPTRVRKCEEQVEAGQLGRGIERAGFGKALRRMVWHSAIALSCAGVAETGQGKMLSWASYLFGGSTAEPEKVENEPTQQESIAMETEPHPGDKDWICTIYLYVSGTGLMLVLLSLADCGHGSHLAALRSHVTCYPGNHGDTPDSCSLLSDASPCKSASSSPSKLSTPGSLSPVSHSRHLYVRTNHGCSVEAWLLTPPSCFTAGSDDVPRVGVSDLENLLIEHPSMSVYKRSCSEGDDSNHSDSSNELNMKSKRSQALSRQTPKRARAISAKAELMSQVMKVKNAQKVQQRHATKRSNKKGLDRRNKVAACDKLTTRKNRVRNPSGQMNGRLPQRKQGGGVMESGGELETAADGGELDGGGGVEDMGNIACVYSAVVGVDGGVVDGGGGGGALPTFDDDGGGNKACETDGGDSGGDEGLMSRNGVLGTDARPAIGGRT